MQSLPNIVISAHPGPGLDNLQRVGEHGGHGRGRRPQPESRGPAHGPAGHSRVVPLQQLVHGELDGRVGDEEQGGTGAVPQARETLLGEDLGQAVQ